MALYVLVRGARYKKYQLLYVEDKTVRWAVGVYTEQINGLLWAQLTRVRDVADDLLILTALFAIGRCGSLRVLAGTESTAYQEQLYFK